MNASNLPLLRAVAWSNHAKTTLRGEIDGLQITFAECSGNGQHSITNEAHAASIEQRCNSYAALVAALEEAEVGMKDATNALDTALYHARRQSLRDYLRKARDVAAERWANLRTALKAAKGEA